MNRLKILTSVVSLLAIILTFQTPSAQEFDFKSLEKEVSKYTVLIDLTIEVSFGMNSTENKERLLGTIVTKDGMILFNGVSIGSEGGFSMRGFSIKTVPTKIKVTTLDDDITYDAELLGVDRFSNIGFLKLKTDKTDFKPIKFETSINYHVGDWLALYMLLPEFISPPLAADVGMISTVVESPESFFLTMGFNSLQMTSVLFNKDNKAVGVLGQLMDPSQASVDASGMIESMGQFGVPLLGIITAEKIDELIANPPDRETPDRGWLGISLQALTADISSYLGIDAVGGIIVNDVIKNSPSQKAGIEIGDILTKINGEPIVVDKEDMLPIFQKGIAEMGPGAEVEFEVIRQTGEKLETLAIFVELEKTPLAAKDADEYESESAEFVVRNMVFSDYLYNDLEEDDFKGVIVSELRPGGLALVGGLGYGDIIQKVGSEEIDSVDKMKEVMEALENEKSKEIIFFIWRNNQTMFVNVQTDW